MIVPSLNFPRETTGNLYLGDKAVVKVPRDPSVVAYAVFLNLRCTWFCWFMWQAKAEEDAPKGWARLD